MRLLNNWPKIGFVDALSLPEIAKQMGADKETTLIAVMQVTPNIPFKIGFKAGSLMQYFQTSVTTTKGKFGMRLGQDPVTFFAFAEDLESDIQLELIEYSKIDNKLYKDLLVY